MSLPSPPESPHPREPEPATPLPAELPNPDQLRAQAHGWVLYFILVSVGVTVLLGLDRWLSRPPTP